MMSSSPLQLPRDPQEPPVLVPDDHAASASALSVPPVLPGVADGPAESAAAVSAALGALGHGLFAWLQPTGLDAVRPLLDHLGDAELETVPAVTTIGPAVAFDQALAALVALDDLEDEKPEAVARPATGLIAGLLTANALGGSPEAVDELLVESVKSVEPLESLESLASLESLDSGTADDDREPDDAAAGSPQDGPSSYSTSRDTIAMLEEIAFLDE